MLISRALLSLSASPLRPSCSQSQSVHSFFVLIYPFHPYPLNLSLRESDDNDDALDFPETTAPTTMLPTTN